MSEDDGPADSISDKLDRIKDIIDENEEVVNTAADYVQSFVGSDERVLEDRKDPLTELHITEERMSLTAEVAGVDATKLDIEPEGDDLLIKFGGEYIRVEDAPDDLELGKANVKMNNGVLNLEMPREEDIESSISETEEEI